MNFQKTHGRKSKHFCKIKVVADHEFYSEPALTWGLRHCLTEEFKFKVRPISFEQLQ